MAFQKTKGRSVFVRPNGMPNLSGFSAVAKSIQDLSDVTTSIGTDIRQQEFNDMLIQADIDGRVAGVRYEGDQLVPLVDTTYASAMNAFGSAEQKALQAKFRESAINTYSASLTLDARNSAKASLEMNPIDPDAVAGGFKGYTDKLQEELDPDTYSILLPKVAAEWQTAIGSARSGRIKQVRKDSIDTNLEVVDHLYNQMSVIARVGMPNDANAEVGTVKRYNEINESINNAFETLKVNGYSDAQITALRKTGVSRVVLEGAKANAEKIFFSPDGGYIAALNFAQEVESSTSKDLSLSPDISFSPKDIIGVADSMRKHISNLQKIQTTKIQEDEKSQIVTTENAKLAIQTGAITSEAQIFGLPVSSGRISSLLTAFRTQSNSNQTTQNAQKAADDKLNSDIFDGHMADFMDITLAPSVRENALTRAESMRGLVPNSKFKGLVKARNKSILDDIKSAGDNAFALIDQNMSEAGGYRITPTEFSNMENMLIDKGFIGEGKNMTLTSWRSKVRQYGADYKKHETEQQELRTAISVASTTGNTTQKQRQALLKAFNPMLDADNEGRTLFHEDADIRENNYQKVIAYSLKYKHVHPEIANALKTLGQATNDQESFDVSLQLFNKLHDSFSLGINNAGTKGLGVGDLMADKMLSDSGVDIMPFFVARELGFPAFSAMKAAELKFTSGTRVSNSLDAKVTIEQSIEENFNTAITSSDLIESFANNFGTGSDRNPAHLAALDSLESSHPSGDLSTAVIRDSRFRSYLISQVKANMITHGLPQNDVGVQLAIRKAVVDVAGNIGLNVDSEGNSSLTFNPWYSQASSSLGANADVVDGGVEGSFFREIRRMSTRSDLAMDEDLRAAIMDEDNVISIVPDQQYGADQTYSAFIQVGDEKTKILSDFHYDFRKTMDYPIMQAAVARIKNSTVKRFFSNMSSVAPYIVKDVSEQIISDLGEDSPFMTFTDESNFRGIMELMNDAQKAVKPVVGFVNKSIADQIDTRSIDEGDVAIIRAWLAGEFDGDVEKSFDDAIKDYYK